MPTLREREANILAKHAMAFRLTHRVQHGCDPSSEEQTKMRESWHGKLSRAAASGGINHQKVVFGASTAGPPRPLTERSHQSPRRTRTRLLDADLRNTRWNNGKNTRTANEVPDDHPGVTDARRHEKDSTNRKGGAACGP